MSQPTQMPLPPLNSPLPVDAQARALWSKPWGNWMTMVWQQLLSLFTLTATISTTNATVTTLATITIPPETTMLIEARAKLVAGIHRLGDIVDDEQSTPGDIVAAVRELSKIAGIEPEPQALPQVSPDALMERCQCAPARNWRSE